MHPAKETNFVFDQMCLPLAVAHAQQDASKTGSIMPSTYSAEVGAPETKPADGQADGIFTLKHFLLKSRKYLTLLHVDKHFQTFNKNTFCISLSLSRIELNSI